MKKKKTGLCSQLSVTFANGSTTDSTSTEKPPTGVWLIDIHKKNLCHNRMIGSDGDQLYTLYYMKKETCILSLPGYAPIHSWFSVWIGHEMSSDLHKNVTNNQNMSNLIKHSHYLSCLGVFLLLYL